MMTSKLPHDFVKNLENIVDLFWSVHGESHDDIHASYLKLADTYVPLRDTVGALSRTFSEEEKRIAKKLVEQNLTPLVLDSPMARRAYEKPLGYAGDFLMMMYLYDNEELGHTSAARVIHRLFCNHPLSQGVVTRMDHVARQLLATRPARITSIGCGPAVEVEHVARYLPRAQWTLIDQDREALAFAGGGGLANTYCRQVDMRALVRGQATVGGNQDFIYCVGLYDYLKQDTAVALTRALYEALAPNGTLLIANAAGPKDHYFDPEFILDWPMVYRGAASMWELGMAVGLHATLEREPLGAYWILQLRKF